MGNSAKFSKISIEVFSEYNKKSWILSLYKYQDAF